MIHAGKLWIDLKPGESGYFIESNIGLGMMNDLMRFGFIL
jgi:hypothetical protein